MIVLYLALVWLLGCGFVRCLLPAPVRGSMHNLLLISLGAGAGIGIASSLYFLVLNWFGPKVVPLASLEGAALVAVLALNVLLRQRQTVLEWGPGPKVPWYISGMFYLAIAFALLMFVFYALSKPHGEWDAWSIWNLRARFLFRSGDAWRDAFSSQLSLTHPDYPLMLPGAIAMCWTLARAESPIAQIGVAFLFTFATAGVLIAALGFLRGKGQALVGGIVMLGSAEFIINGANQYADVPLSFFVLATLALLCLQDRYPQDLRFTVLAGFMAGLAGWTKNEGLLFVAAAIVALAWGKLRYGDRAVLAPQLLRFTAGLLPPLAVIAFFKLRFAPANDLLAHPAGQMLAHLADFGRWITALEGYVKAPFRLGSFLLPVILVLALYWYLVRFKVEEQDRSTLADVLLTLGLTLAGEFLVYVALPGDIVWQLNTSLGRLLLQLWPAGLLAFFFAVNPPQLVAEATVPKGKPAKRTPKPKSMPRKAETR